jgi:DNA invertase Pin-like site-specific DNA recombinase
MGIKIGYARCSTDKQDPEANPLILLELGVSDDRVHLDRACSGSGRASKLPPARRAHVRNLHAAGEHTIAELAELFEVSRQTVYRVLERAARVAA